MARRQRQVGYYVPTGVPTGAVGGVRHVVSGGWYRSGTGVSSRECTTGWYIDGRAVWGVPLRVH